MKINEILTSIGILLSFGVGAIGLIISLKNSKKTIFINSVTAARIQYIQSLRNGISEFCGLVYAYHGNGLKTGSAEAFEIQKRYDNLRYLIELHLNIEDDFFDTKILSMIKGIRNIKDGTSISDVDKAIDPLILIMQYLLKLEWEGVKKESQKGNLSETRKNKMYNKYQQLYLKRVES